MTYLHPRATLVATLLAFGLGAAPAAHAATTSGGASAGGSSAASTTPGASTSRSTGDATTAGGSAADQDESPVPGASSGASADPIATRTLTLTASQTKSVQRRVRVKADGAMGARTRTAIKRYQRVQALTLTGRPNIETLRAMRLKIADRYEAKLRAATTAASDAGADASTVPVSFDGGSGASGQALAAARTAIGTPYKSAGTTTAGFDCSGLTQWAFGQAGVKLPRTSFDQYREGTAVDKSAIQPGDLVFFDTAGAGASHVGIAASSTTVISATTGGVKEHDIASGYWASHYVGARRLGDAPTATAARASTTP